MFITRFAPSPTGLLHLGHAYAAMTAFRAAQRAGGVLLLRIEDIDAVRCKPEYEAAIYDDLDWLGIEWALPVRRQSDHLADYRLALEALVARGLCYRCFKTRSEIMNEIARAPHLSQSGPDGAAYIGAPLDLYEERSLLADGAPFAWRLSVTAARAALGGFGGLSFIEEDIDGANPRHIAATPEIFGDVVLGRKDSGASYHLASVFDDASAGVTHVIRGEDLAPAAHLHCLLYALLDAPAPIYRHHRLITDETGRRLAKRDNAATLQSLRSAGASAAEVLRRLGFTD